MAEEIETNPPAELAFYGPYTRNQVSAIIIHNTDQTARIAYKIKVTDNKRFKFDVATDVAGIIEPAKYKSISITMLPQDPTSLPPAKFQITTCKLLNDDPADPKACFALGKEALQKEINVKFS